MKFGAYRTKEDKLMYSGNKIFSSIPNIRRIKPPSSLTKRHIEIRESSKKWEAIMKIWNAVFVASNKFMRENEVLLFDLPIITRMISSPGSLTGTIPSDVDPFQIKFFDKETFLTQSSQLYLEFAITNPAMKKVYCWEKSFRREKADFRHLPEFTHIEFEGNINFKDNLEFQKNYLQFVIEYLIKNCTKEVGVFLKAKDIASLEEISQMKDFEKITFHEAFRLLKEKTRNRKYDKITIENFSAYEEVLLLEIIKKPLFVTHFIEEEVAFYHAQDKQNPELAVNADLLFPGYGELVGSGERVHTREETRKKAKHFKLNMKDYQPYIDSRDPNNPKVHSGWGMGIERFIQATLMLPFIWDAKPFPRINNQNHP
jgi:asparaginyl-tRNA synthetase